MDTLTLYIYLGVHLWTPLTLYKSRSTPVVTPNIIYISRSTPVDTPNIIYISRSTPVDTPNYIYISRSTPVDTPKSDRKSPSASDRASDGYGTTSNSSNSSEQVTSRGVRIYQEITLESRNSSVNLLLVN